MLTRVLTFVRNAYRRARSFATELRLVFVDTVPVNVTLNEIVVDCRVTHDCVNSAMEMRKASGNEIAIHDRETFSRLHAFITIRFLSSHFFPIHVGRQMYR